VERWVFIRAKRCTTRTGAIRSFRGNHGAGTPISLGNQWGAAPSQVEGIAATLTLRGAGGRVRVWALDHRGARESSPPLLCYRPS
jgi:hypothetical protein